MAKFRCLVCGYIYDEAEGDVANDVPAGTAFADLSDDWECPICMVGKDQFVEEE